MVSSGRGETGSCLVRTTQSYTNNGRYLINVVKTWWNGWRQVKRHPWWRHEMETFSALLALCEGTSPVTGEFPSQRPVSRSFGDFFDLRLNKRLSQQSRRLWFETPSRSLWRHCNVMEWVKTGEKGYLKWSSCLHICVSCRAPRHHISISHRTSFSLIRRLYTLVIRATKHFEVEIGLFQDNQGNIITADVLAPWGYRASAATVLGMDKGDELSGRWGV